SSPALGSGWQLDGFESLLDRRQAFVGGENAFARGDERSGNRFQIHSRHDQEPTLLPCFEKGKIIERHATSERGASALIITPKFQGNVFAESQRDSATKPRVARNELPWVSVGDISNPERVASSCMPWLTQPRWGCDRNEPPPRVVALLQPWALRRNP